MARLNIVRPGMLTTVQDIGRYGQGHLGVPQQGALDPYALRWALRLAGAGRGDAALEITLLGPVIEVQDACFAALAGAELGAQLNGVPWRTGTSQRLRPGDLLTFRAPAEGLRAYLAFRGGVAGDMVLGSRATDLQSGIGGHHGRALRAGDVLEVGDGDGEPAAAPVPTAILRESLRVLPGPRDDLFPEGALRQLTSAPYRVTPEADRVGMRLVGPEVPGAPGDIPSEGIPLGGIEILPSGQPIVLLQGRGSVGGYPVLATVISADVPALSQLRPGSRLRFEVASLAAARLAREEMERSLALPPHPLP